MKEKIKEMISAHGWVEGRKGKDYIEYSKEDKGGRKLNLFWDGDRVEVVLFFKGRGLLWEWDSSLSGEALALLLEAEEKT